VNAVRAGTWRAHAEEVPGFREISHTEPFGRRAEFCQGRVYCFFGVRADQHIQANGLPMSWQTQTVRLALGAARYRPALEAVEWPPATPAA
jgi:hypothetical protein